tara:strand:+ start:9567 stop:10490 length:924 start_codon:yes stop_codon:yes gene_type:complete
MIKISIIIPVFNSEKTIEPLVKSLINKFDDKYEIEIILINDFSTDNSEEICIELYNSFSDKIKLYSLGKNFGEHNAVMAGFNHTSGDWIIVMDDDFQNPVEEVEKLIQFSISNTYDVVYTYYEDKKHSLLRNCGSAINNLLANYMLKKPKDLYLSSFKSIHKNIVIEVIKYQLPYPYIDGLILRATNNIGKILALHKSREQGKSGYTTNKLISLWLNMFTNFSVLPLRISTILGFILSLFGFSFGIFTILEKLNHPNIPQGYASLITLITIMFGVQLIAVGLIGEYIGRMFISVNKQPQYYISKRYE